MLGAQPIFTVHAELEPIMNLGHTPYGERRVIGISGGTIRGAKLNGRVLPGGSDWQIIRAWMSAAPSAPPTSRRATPSKATPARASWSTAPACGTARRR